jgi:hypothetical protein
VENPAPQFITLFPASAVQRTGATSAVERERAAAYRHPYFTGSPSIRQQIEAVNEEPFRRLEKQLDQRRLAVG